MDTGDYREISLNRFGKFDSAVWQDAHLNLFVNSAHERYGPLKYTKPIRFDLYPADPVSGIADADFYSTAQTTNRLDTQRYLAPSPHSASLSRTATTPLRVQGKNMSLAIVHSRAQVGVEAPAVTVETHLANGLPRRPHWPVG